MNTTSLIHNRRGQYQFLPGIDPYSSGVIADPGVEIVHVTLARHLPWQIGLHSARRYVEALGRNVQSLCAVELRCPEPHAIDGFVEFNNQYRSVIREWDMLVDSHNPVARTNVAPVHAAPHETVLHAFSFTRPCEDPRHTFVVAGGGELPTRALDRDRIVRVGETSADALNEKAQCVVGIMRHRLNKLDADDQMISTVDVYTAHPIHQIVTDVIIPAIPRVRQLGVHWFCSQPPVREIEFEMDLRGVRSEVVVDLTNWS